jgi:hypothetical protein
MSTLVKKMKIKKLRITDETGVEHEFEGEGIVHLRGVGPDGILTVETTLRITHG